MRNSRELENKRTSYRSVLGIVKAMKGLSAANVRKGASALGFTRTYRDFVSGAASEVVSLPGVRLAESGERRLLVAFGSQYGLCGPLNDHVIAEVRRLFKEPGGFGTVMAVGSRLCTGMAGAGMPSCERMEGPGSVDGIQETIGGLLENIYDRYRAEGFDELYFAYPTFYGDSIDVKSVRVIPPEFETLGEDHDPPLMQLDYHNLMDGIFEEYIYVSLFATALEAVIAENEARMRAMEVAEKNIVKKIDDVTLSYNYAIQEEVTSELIEIIGGYEALGGAG